MSEILGERPDAVHVSEVDAMRFTGGRMALEKGV